MPDVPPTTTPPTPDAPPPGAAASPGKAADPPAQPTAAPGETPPPADAKPDPKEGAMLASIRAREQKLVQRQQELARQQAEFEQRNARTAQEVAAAQQHMQLAKADPLRYLRELHGWTEDQIAGRIVNGGKPTALEAQAKLERELAELRDWKQQQVQAAESQTRQQRIEAARAEFVQVAKDDTRWPLAAAWTPAKLIARGEAIALEHARGGVSLSDEDILDKLEEELGEIAAIKSKVTTKQAAANASPKETPGGATNPTAPPMTLTSGGGPASTLAKVDTLKMTKAELDAYTKKVIAEGRANGTITG